MKILGLDLSTKTGFALIDNDKLVTFGTFFDLKKNHKVPDSFLELVEDYQHLHYAKQVAEFVYKLISQHNPDIIVIEQTNKGRQRTSQKMLEFIHCEVLDTIQANLGKAHIVKYIDTSQWRKLLSVKLSKEQREHNKRVKHKLARGKVTPKHLSVAWANQTFGLSLKIKDNDAADAIALCVAAKKNFFKKSIPSPDLEKIFSE